MKEEKLGTLVHRRNRSCRLKTFFSHFALLPLRYLFSFSCQDSHSGRRERTSRRCDLLIVQRVFLDFALFPSHVFLGAHSKICNYRPEYSSSSSSFQGSSRFRQNFFFECFFLVTRLRWIRKNHKVLIGREVCFDDSSNDIDVVGDFPASARDLSHWDFKAIVIVVEVFFL